MMNRKNFGGGSGIVVDVCSLHGTFFDAGELPRVLDFVKRGGLAKANAALQRAPTSPPALGGAYSLPERAPTSLLDDLSGLVGFLVDVLVRK